MVKVNNHILVGEDIGTTLQHLPVTVEWVLLQIYKVLLIAPVVPHRSLLSPGPLVTINNNPNPKTNMRSAACGS